MDTSTRSEHVEQWLRASKREAQQGNQAVAITFANMAWLLEHADSWLPPVIKSAGEQVQKYVNNLNRAASDLDDIL